MTVLVFILLLFFIFAFEDCKSLVVMESALRAGQDARNSRSPAFVARVIEPNVQPETLGRRHFSYHNFVPLICTLSTGLLHTFSLPMFTDMPIFPSMRILMRGKFPQRTIDMASFSLVGVALVHAVYIMGRDDTM